MFFFIKRKKIGRLNSKFFFSTGVIVFEDMKFMIENILTILFKKVMIFYWNTKYQLIII